MSKLLETKAKWKVTQKATLKFVVNNCLATSNPDFLGAVGLPLKPHTLTHPTYLVMAEPLRATLSQATHSRFLERLDMGHKKVWSLPGLMGSRCETWGLQNEGQKPAVGIKAGECSVVRITHSGSGSAPVLTLRTVTLAICPNFSRLPSL